MVEIITLFSLFSFFSHIRKCIGGHFKQSRFPTASRPAQGNVRNCAIGNVILGQRVGGDGNTGKEIHLSEK